LLIWPFLSRQPNNVVAPYALTRPSVMLDGISDVWKRCHVTPADVIVLFCRATGNGVTRSNLWKIITIWYDVGWRCNYMKIVALNEIYNFVVLSFFIWGH
jgi:hypothetical protein